MQAVNGRYLVGFKVSKQRIINYRKNQERTSQYRIVYHKTLQILRSAKCLSLADNIKKLKVRTKNDKTK